ncbi:MAG: DUF2341 domain-containing protein, partial [Thermoplasmata archaeon]|nr:DUF2341 domain-containing protein [Thermoplasmata archaeon]
DTPYPFIAGGTNQDNWPHTVPNGWNNPHPEQYVLNVDQGLWYETIQSAVDDASAGHTLWVSAGTYNENVVIDKSLTLEGEDRDTTIIDGGGVGDVVYIGVDWVNVTGFTMTGSGSNWDDVGIELSGVQNCRIDNNTANNNDYGIWLQLSSSNTITHNTANNNTWFGILLDASSNNVVANNTANNNFLGIYLKSSSNNVVVNNNANNNTNYSIYLRSSNNNTITHNTANNNNDYGILLNTSNNNTITHNTANNNWFGIHLQTSSNNIVTNNTASNNTHSIYLETSNNNTISNNTADNNLYGIYIHASSNNTITNNTPNNSPWCGIHLQTSNNNTIYHNNIISNTNQAYDDGTNIWNLPYPGGGNYWSDWTTPDVNGDGFVDEPYDIDGGTNQDLWPFARESGWLCLVRNVDTDEYFLTIQEAIDDVDTLDCHTLLAGLGVYYENVQVTKALTITTGDRVNTIVDAGGGDAFTILANEVTISGFTIRHAARGIVAENVADCSIDDNLLLAVLPEFPMERSIEVENPSVLDLYGYQVRMVVPYSAGMQPDFDDIRFLGEDGSFLPYWVEEYTFGVEATVWIYIPLLPAMENTTIYMRYNNSGAVSMSDGAS